MAIRVAIYVSVLALCLAGPLGAEPPQVAAGPALGATVAPESQGVSSAGVRSLSEAMRELVDQQKLAGVTTLLARRGEVVHFEAYGKADTAEGTPLAPDSIFRIASMTKPVTGVAMMQLYEQGKWRLDDPVAKHIPEFVNLKVKRADGGTEPQRSPMTMAQLMSHSAGFGVSAIYGDLGLRDGDLADMIEKLASRPLETQPGTAWDYGPSVDIQGYVVEKLSGESLDAYFAKNIFEPLGMADTGFWVPEQKASRVVAVHSYDAEGRVQTARPNEVRTSKPKFLSGSGGLLSTAQDYWKFAQAVANGGALAGRRILAPETVELMRTNVLAEGVAVDLYGPGQSGLGFGLDFAIVMDPEASGTPLGRGSYYWGGAFGTWFWIDPTNDLVFVGMIQNQGGSRPDQGTPPVRSLAYEATYGALTDGPR
jgi:CubicO group peptidase (beta-lactamase class C family)